MESELLLQELDGPSGAADDPAAIIDRGTFRQIGIQIYDLRASICHRELRARGPTWCPMTCPAVTLGRKTCRHLQKARIARDLACEGRWVDRENKQGRQGIKAVKGEKDRKPRKARKAGKVNNKKKAGKVEGSKEAEAWES